MKSRECVTTNLIFKSLKFDSYIYICIYVFIIFNVVVLQVIFGYRKITPEGK